MKFVVNDEVTWLSKSQNSKDATIADRIMIGDRPEDKEAALAAGFRFLDAEEWRNGASVEVVDED